MSGRLKFLLAVLAVGTGLSFWYTMNYAVPDLPRDGTANALAQVTAEQTCGDKDADGLCDYDETYWGSDFTNPDSDEDGFMDGEEVLSGHDPMKAGPDDLLNDKRNLTERAGSLLLGGLVAGDLKPDSPNYKASIQALVDEIFNQYDANTAAELDSVTISSGSIDQLIGYGLTMSGLMKPMFNEIAENHDAFLETIRGIPLADLPVLDKKSSESYAKFVAAADAEAAAFGDRARAVKAVRVPPQMVKFHRSLLLYLRGTQQRYLSVRDITRDPLMGMISLQVLRTLTNATPLELTVSFQNQIAAAINSQ